jgi:hypothetical protein
MKFDWDQRLANDTNCFDVMRLALANLLFLSIPISCRSTARQPSRSLIFTGPDPFWSNGCRFFLRDQRVSDRSKPTTPLHRSISIESSSSWIATLALSRVVALPRSLSVF